MAQTEALFNGSGSQTLCEDKPACPLHPGQTQPQAEPPGPSPAQVTLGPSPMEDHGALRTCDRLNVTEQEAQAHPRVTVNTVSVPLV